MIDQKTSESFEKKPALSLKSIFQTAAAFTLFGSQVFPCKEKTQKKQGNEHIRHKMSKNSLPRKIQQKVFECKVFHFARK